MMRLFSGGTDTVCSRANIRDYTSLKKMPFKMASTVIVFILAALLHPEIQKTAQEELDAVTMRERLPTLKDRPRLPFVDAICKEVIRWRPITPLGEFLPSNSPLLRRSFTTDRCTSRKHKR